VTIWASEMAQVEQIALSGNPGAFHLRQTKATPSEPVPSLSSPPLVLTQTRLVTPPGGDRITIAWDVTDARYGGSAAEGSKTIYARLKYKDGTWSRMYLTTVRYYQHMTTPTPTPTATRTPVGYVSPTWTPSPTPMATATQTYTPSPTPTVGELCVRVFHDRNADLSYKPGAEELLPGAQLTVYDSAFTVLRRHTTDGSGPLCVGGLTAGTYYVREDDPPGYVSSVRFFSVPVVANRSITLSIGDHLAAAGR